MKLILVLAALGLELSACTPKSTDAVPGKITGVVNVSPELAKKMKPTDILYIIARTQQGGPPTAVKRVSHPQFPMKYTLGPEDSMIAGMGDAGFAGGSNLTLAARLSRSGNAMPSPGDLEGVYVKNPAHPSDAGVDIVIDRER